LIGRGGGVCGSVTLYCPEFNPFEYVFFVNYKTICCAKAGVLDPDPHRNRIGSTFDGRLDPDPDPGGVKRAKIKEKTQPKER
jgi:hypothetical protein